MGIMHISSFISHSSSRQPPVGQLGSLALGGFCLCLALHSLFSYYILYDCSQYLLPLPAIYGAPPCGGLDFLTLLTPDLVLWLSLANEMQAKWTNAFSEKLWEWSHRLTIALFFVRKSGVPQLERQPNHDGCSGASHWDFEVLTTA